MRSVEHSRRHSDLKRVHPIPQQLKMAIGVALVALLFVSTASTSSQHQGNVHNYTNKSTEFKVQLSIETSATPIEAVRNSEARI